VTPSDGPEARDVDGSTPTPSVGPGTIARQWGRIGVLGFGGPPTHIAMLRRLCVTDRRWLSATEFEDGIAATNLLPGPASTQLAIFCAWRLGGTVGALVGGVCFIVPGLVAILALSALFFAAHPPLWVLGAAAGAGAAVPAVAVHASTELMPASWQRSGPARSSRIRWVAYAVAGAAAAATVGPWLVLVLLLCGVVEVVARSRDGPPAARRTHLVGPLLGTTATVGGVGALAWVALKVGALSYGGGFVIIPLMQHDAVHTYHWMTASQFLDAVALGQITPGPVVQTVAVVGYAAAGLGGGLLAAAVAFAPSFVFVLVGGPRFDQLRASRRVQAFLAGAGPASLGAIAGSAVPLALALAHWWQLGVTGVAALGLLGLRRGVVSVLVGAGTIGVVAALAGAPVPH
jgi:chromate transporter